jgi:hypothetical protein
MFRVGQKVRCIDNTNRTIELKKGEIYKVEAIGINRAGQLLKTIYVEGVEDPCSNTRFVSA